MTDDIDRALARLKAELGATIDSRLRSIADEARSLERARCAVIVRRYPLIGWFIARKLWS